MKITEVHFSDNPTLGLRAIKMQGLGNTVVLAGRNGAGKSRFIQHLINWPKEYQAEVETVERIKKLENRIEKFPDTSRDVFKQEVEKQRRILTHRRQLVLTEDKKPVIIPFVPTEINLTDPQQVTHQNMIQYASATGTPGVGQLRQGTFALIQSLQDRYREATHQQRMIDDKVADNAISEYERLRDLIHVFLGTEITRSIDQQAELFGLPLGQSALSAGQKVILQLCIAIHAQGARLNDLILVMDEPENHLHPAALLDLVTVIQERLGTGQMWIATHSITLLANIEPSCIWWMDDNGVSKAGNIPDKVLSGLLGDEKRREKLADFLDLPFELASNRFVMECLSTPGTVDFKEGDPQTQQIRKIIADRLRNQSALRILDYGAGRGRLACELHDAWPSDGDSKVDYVAFDPSKKDRASCASAIEALYGSAEGRLFSEPAALRAKYDDESFDIIVMCNVLHEIPCERWCDLFGETGWFSSLLKPDGFLIIAEVQQLPYGEHAHSCGFLVLDTAQIRRLFSVKEGDHQLFAVAESSGGWLKAHLVAREFVRRYNSEQLQAALRDLSITSRDQIRSLRADGTGYRQGRKHGFWVQQLANAELSISR